MEIPSISFHMSIISTSAPTYPETIEKSQLLRGIWVLGLLRSKSSVFLGIGSMDRYTIQGSLSESICMKHIVGQKNIWILHGIIEEGIMVVVGGPNRFV